jgi:hypothetical protein
MQPCEIRIDFRGRSFATVKLEVGYDELEATREPVELVASAEVADLFAGLGLQNPDPIAVLPIHQISQKIHACTEPGSRRAHDLVDLQLVADQIDGLRLISHTTQRLFRFRQQHSWPPHVEPGEGWTQLYAAAAKGLDVLPDVDQATTWLNTNMTELVAAT